MIDNIPAGANNTRLFSSRTWFKPVANIKSARKRARQAEKTRKHNMGLRSEMRTSIKNVVKACDKGDKDAATLAYKGAVAVIDVTCTSARAPSVVHTDRRAVGSVAHSCRSSTASAPA